MHYASGGYDIPDKWKHDKLLKNKHGDTIAMIYASYVYIPPKKWEY